MAPCPLTSDGIVVVKALVTVAVGKAALICSPIMEDMSSFISVMKSAGSRLGLQ